MVARSRHLNARSRESQRIDRECIVEMNSLYTRHSHGQSAQNRSQPARYPGSASDRTECHACRQALAPESTLGQCSAAQAAADFRGSLAVSCARWDVPDDTWAVIIAAVTDGPCRHGTCLGAAASV